MLALVAWLFCETHLAVKRDQKNGRVVNYRLKKERCVYGVVTSVFAISYIGRWYILLHWFCATSDDVQATVFEIYMTYNTVYWFEAMSMGVLMAFHCKNFTTERSMFDDDDTLLVETEFKTTQLNAAKKGGLNAIKATLANDASATSIQLRAAAKDA